MPLPPSPPTPAAYCPLVDQPTSSQLVLYNFLSGAPDRSVLNSVWAWNGSNWTEINGPTDALRTNPVMTSTGPNVMLFGGSSLPSPLDNQEIQESFDGTNWSIVHFTPLPIPNVNVPTDRINAMATYISGANQVVMFGGATSNEDLPETWVFNPANTTWHKPHQITPPSWRLQASICSNGNIALMFGGVVAIGSSMLNDVWQFSGNAWTQLTTINTPSPRAGHAMIWEATANRFVVTGGYTTSGVFLNETWALDMGSLTWTMLTPNSFPSGRTGVSFCWDSTRQEGILWGGMTATGLSNETFRWRGGNFVWVQGV